MPLCPTEGLRFSPRSPTVGGGGQVRRYALSVKEAMFVKRGRRHQKSWYVPPLPPPVAVFTCRGCGVTLTHPLRRLDDATAISEKPLAPLVQSGHYWLVTPEHPPADYSIQGKYVLVTDFTGHYAMGQDALINVGCHPDRERWSGCCGPSGLGGPNRVCGCGRPVGTERADCLSSVAVYLDPAAVRAVEKNDEPAK